MVDVYSCDHVENAIIAASFSINMDDFTNSSQEFTMATHQYTRSTGQSLTYTISYADGEYFIERDGVMKKSTPDALALGIAPHEAKASLMLKMAIADIEGLNGMEE